jgi:hypothetical protein
VLPSSTDIAKEKAPKLAAEFDKSGLRHVEPKVKTSIEGENEKQHLQYIQANQSKIIDNIFSH